MVRRRETVVWCAFAVCVVLSLSGFAEDLRAQASSPVFVVYGRMTGQSGDPINGSYTIVVENLRTGAELQNNLGTAVDAGKYSVAFIHPSWSGSAAEVGDLIEISVKLIGDATKRVYAQHEVTFEEILDMRARIDLVENVVSLDMRTWGGIKSLYAVE